MKKIGVLVSGGGTNLQALIDAQQNGIIKHGKIVTVVSDRAGVYALERAKKAGIDYAVIERKSFQNRVDFDKAVAEYLLCKQVDLVVMSGFLSIVGDKFLRHFANRIINVHPSLIPSFCGKGYYGLKVHEAALDYGVKVTGATVHFVNEVTDGGAIILQKCVEVKADDTPQTLQERVMQEAEWQILPRAVELFCADRLKIEGRKVIIREEL